MAQAGSPSVPVGITMAARLGHQQKYSFEGATGLRQMSISCEFSAPIPVEFRADLVSAPIGDIGLDDLTATAHRCQRTAERIAAVPWDVVQMSVHHQGLYRASFEGRDAVFEQGDVSLLALQRGFDYVTRESSRTTTVSIPTRLLGPQAVQIDSLLARRLQRTTLTEAIKAFVASLSQGVLVAHSKESEFIALALVDLARALIANQLGEPMPPEDVEHGLRVEIHEYLNRRLSEPSLSPESIAAAMNISVRYLYTLFASEDHTVARYIRGLRSRKIAAALQTTGPSFAELAGRYGFTSSDSARRAFIQEFGMPPSDYRARQPGANQTSSPATL